MSKLKIKRVELHKSGKKVILTFAQSVVGKGGEPVLKDVKETIYKEPNEDLVSAFVKLAPHFMFVQQIFPTVADESFVDDFLFTDDVRFKGVNVVSVELKGKDLDFVVIEGSKTNDKGETSKWKASQVWLGDESEKAYGLMSLLDSNVQEVMKEAEEFYNGKYKASNQVALEL